MREARTRSPYLAYFIAGGLGDMSAACVSHPMDLIKVRQQLQGELSHKRQPSGFRALYRIFRNIIRVEGISGLYDGLSASLLRQGTFSTMRHGFFAVGCAQILAPSAGIFGTRPSHPANGVSIPQQIAIGFVTGAASAAVANPTDVILIRMQADKHWAPEGRRNYRNALSGLMSVVRDEGVKVLWRGCSPCVARATLVTSTQIPTYFTVRSWLLDRFGHYFRSSTDVKVHFLSATCSAGVASVATQPVDVVKTRLMNMQPQARAGGTGVGEYASPFDCVLRIWRTEGIRGFYKGLGATFSRLIPHTIVLWTVQEQILNAYFKKY